MHVEILNIIHFSHSISLVPGACKFVNHKPNTPECVIYDDLNLFFAPTESFYMKGSVIKTYLSLTLVTCISNDKI